MHAQALGNVFFDSRWVGQHGIGRFAAEVQRRIEFAGEIQAGCLPSHPLDTFVMSCQLRRYRDSIVYSPGFNAPLTGLDRYVMTVHDLNHIDIPGHHLLKRLYYRVILKRACQKAAKVFTVSEFSRRRIIEWAQVRDTQVVNVGNGVGAAFTSEGASYSPGYRYLLCVSNRRSHKNEERMLLAFASANVESLKLLVTGEPTEKLSHLIKCAGLDRRVVFTGRLSDGELAARYRGATALLFASLYEGFGLPIIEAMSCGCPVVTSSVTAMPEVAGAAALLVDPLSVENIAGAISDIACDRAGIASVLRQRGLERAKAFDWGQVAQRVYRELAEA